ncbi:MAG: peptidyl-prolyl cis-trans isomerase [Sandaracinaceae bacterium]|nr:peptidyl-prolyl cis-trans isomerase [Sandaracinaceae bacterium]
MRRVVALTLVSFLVSGLALAQEGDEPPVLRDPTMPQPPQPRTPEPERSPEDVARRARVIARVGEARVTVGQVEDAINEQSPFVRVRYRDPAELRAFAESMVRFELLARAAERAHFGDDPEVRRASQQNAVQQLIRRDFDELLTVESVPQADVQAYYDAHPDEFSTPEMRRAAHIRVGSREEAERLLPEARAADTRAFRQLARDHSTDPETRLRGGDLRYFDEEGRARNERDPAIDPGLARAAFALGASGETAGEPVQVGEEWSIVRLTGRRPAEHRTIEQAAPTIRLRLWRQNRQGTIEDFVARLRREAHVDNVDYDLLRRIRLDEPAREDAEDEDEDDAPRPAAAPPSLEDIRPTPADTESPEAE